MKGAAIIKQKGQSAVEFAFIVPLFMVIVLGMIYAGILFMDYLQYNNDARAIAREVAFMPAENFTEDNGVSKLSAAKTKELADFYFKNRTDMYNATLEPPEKNDSDSLVTVKISFELNGTWGLSKFINFPPSTLKTIVFTMPIETTVTTIAE